METELYQFVFVRPAMHTADRKYGPGDVPGGTTTVVDQLPRPSVETNGMSPFAP
jgi:hypothetical protein